MTAWLCPECNDKIDREQQGTLSFDMRDGQAPPPGRCWSCGRRRLEAVPDRIDHTPTEER